MRASTFMELVLKHCAWSLKHDINLVEMCSYIRRFLTLARLAYFKKDSFHVKKSFNYNLLAQTISVANISYRVAVEERAHNTVNTQLFHSIFGHSTLFHSCIHFNLYKKWIYTERHSFPLLSAIAALWMYLFNFGEFHFEVRPAKKTHTQTHTVISVMQTKPNQTKERKCRRCICSIIPAENNGI